MLRTNSDGQSTIEFVLVIPLLFLILFLTLQIFYTAYVSLAVQRAALAVARESSITGDVTTATLRKKLFLALIPLSSLHQATLAGILGASYSRTLSPNQENVVVRVRYPMPIWVPFAGKVLGEKLSFPAPNFSLDQEGLRDIFRLLGRTAPNLSSSGAHLPYFKWVVFQAVTHNEGYCRRVTHEKP